MEEQNRPGDGRRNGGPPPAGGRRRRRRRRRSRGPGDGFGPPPGPRGPEVAHSGRISPFELFCALYLGITPHNTYRQTNLAQVARRFNTSPEAIKALLERYAMDTADLSRARFDVGLAQLDMQVLPDGIDRTEQAKVLWNEFLGDSPATRKAIEQALREDEADDDDDADDDGDDGDEDEAQESAPAPLEASASPADGAGAGSRRPRARRGVGDDTSAADGA